MECTALYVGEEKNITKQDIDLSLQVILRRYYEKIQSIEKRLKNVRELLGELDGFEPLKPVASPEEVKGNAEMQQLLDEYHKRIVVIENRIGAYRKYLES